MSSGSWTNSDGLYLQFGTAKAAAEGGGEYAMWGPNRVAEVVINLSSITAVTTQTIVSNTLFFPEGQGLTVEKVELFTEIAASTTGGPTLSIGLMQGDRVTTASAGGATAFITTVSSTSMTTAGQLTTYTAGQSGAGGLIGVYNTQWNTNTSGTNSVGGYITAQLGATTATGQVRVRIYYHGVGTIQN